MKEPAPVPVKFHLNLEPPNDGGAAVEVKKQQSKFKISKVRIIRLLRYGIRKFEFATKSFY